ncbi:hypothetical protein [Nonomuraea sp. NPDC049709]|uniref:hypothetical protein n=1 Tax=Nonomuraea sp. NPDC049709 TaxID=3154736 RepID=UPI00343E5ABC
MAADQEFSWPITTRRWWGDLYELCPDDLLDDLNGARDYYYIHKGIAAQAVNLHETLDRRCRFLSVSIHAPAYCGRVTGTTVSR